MTTGKRWQAAFLRLLICACFAAVLTAMVLRYSFRHGRLSMYLRFDDIGYIDDGLYRLSALEQGGWRAVWKDYLERPPHSPYSDFFAMAALGVLGKHDWAPYAANGLLALAFFLAADSLLVGMKFCLRLGCLAFFGTVPLVGMAVHEFLPDFAVALVTAMGILLLVSRPFVPSPPRHKLFVGILFGLALLGKPPVFPATLAFFVAAAVLASLCDRYAYGHRVSLGKLAGSWLLCLIPLVLIPLPHYLLNFRQILQYINENQFSPHAKVWVLHGSLIGHVLHYLVGDSGQLMLGKHLWLLAGILVLGAIAVVRSRRAGDRIVAAALAAMLVLTWLQPTLNPHKQLYLGLTFQVFLVLLGLHVLNRFIIGPGEWNRRLPRYAAPIALAVSIAVVLVMVRMRFDGNAYPDEQRRNRTRIVNAIYDEISRRAHAEGVTPNVLLSGAGAINGSLYRYYALKESRQFGLKFGIYTPPDSKDADVFASMLEHHNFVVGADPGAGFYAENLWSTQIQGALLEKIREYRHVNTLTLRVDAGLHLRGQADWEEFEQIGKYTDPRVGRSLYLFQRRHRHEPIVPYQLSKHESRTENGFVKRGCAGTIP
jgi:hypothetical protein